MDIVEYLETDDFKALRLAGNKSLPFADPMLTSHLQLRMDKAPFFRAGCNYLSEGDIMQWLINRSKIVINDANAAICPSRVAYLVANGFLNSISQIIILDAGSHHETISQLAKLPNVDSLMLVDSGESLDELELITTYIGNMRSLKKLDIEFDCVVSGSRLSFLNDLKRLKYLRLRGFDLSEGIHNMGNLNLDTLHLCHGNFYSSPDDDVDQNDLLHLSNMTNLKNLHLEGFDCLTSSGFEPFCASESMTNLVLKHCQELCEETLPTIGRLTSLKSFHIVHSAFDDVPVFQKNDLKHLNSLSDLKSLSLFYVIENISDLRILRGLSSLETLNIAFDEEIDEEDLENICTSFLATFASLQKVRIFSEESMNRSFRCGNLEIEFAQFNFGDLVYLG